MRAILQTAALAALLSAFGVHAQKLDPVQDLEQMARQFSGATVAGEQQSGVMMFVSLSMPPAVLKELARQAAQADVTLVLRGFSKERPNGPPMDMEATTQRITQLLAPTGASRETVTGPWAVDPQAFKNFGITKVPALVVARQRLPGPQCQQAAAAGSKGDALGQMCAAEWDASVVYGDVSLNESLRRAARTQDLELARLANRTLERLEGRNNQHRATPQASPENTPQPQNRSTQGGIRIR